MAKDHLSSNLDIVGTYVSKPRVARYMDSAGGDQVRAYELYLWNSRLAGSLFEDLGHLEVFVRNALQPNLQAWHRSRHHQGCWLDDPDEVLHESLRNKISIARRDLERLKKLPLDQQLPGQVMTGLSFGFWVDLLRSDYHTSLWTPWLHKSFPHFAGSRRGVVYLRLQKLRKLRNRIAHHEPIYEELVKELHSDLLKVLGWIDPALAHWVQDGSRTIELWNNRPHDSGTHN
ncbi:Abi family protein [soil metagenome]